MNTNLNDYPEPRFCGYVGMPRALHLDQFARYVYDIFKSNVYLVGSALKTKSWHDLDIVVILSDEEWHKYGFGNPQDRFKNKSWIAYCMAISCFGKQMLGCEVDFQIHQQSYSQIHRDDPKLIIGQ